MSSVTDSSIDYARLAAEIARQSEKMITRLVDERVRLGTGVVQGGPYSSFTVLRDGRIDWAGGVPPGDGIGIFGATTSIPDDTDTVVEWFETPRWRNSGYFDEGDRTTIMLPAAGRWLLFTKTGFTLSGSPGPSGADIRSWFSSAEDGELETASVVNINTAGSGSIYTSGTVTITIPWVTFEPTSIQVHVQQVSGDAAIGYSHVAVTRIQ